MKNKIQKIFFILFALILTISLSSCVVMPFDSEDDNYGDLTNGVMTESVIEANFTVFLSSYNKNIVGVKTQETSAQGSGVIFYKETTVSQKNTFYILTNNHVIYKNPNYSYHEYSVRDCYGEVYKASLVCYDPNYDLAVVAFTIDKDYKVLTFAEKNAEVGDTVISIGQPLGIINSVTIGKIERYSEVSLEGAEGQNSNVSNVKFNVIKHSAPINSGSSGGVLLDKEYNICGINYAAAVVEDDKSFVSGYAIPLDKVKTFLTDKFYALF